MTDFFDNEGRDSPQSVAASRAALAVLVWPGIPIACVVIALILL